MDKGTYFQERCEAFDDSPELAKTAHRLSQDLKGDYNEHGYYMAEAAVQIKGLWELVKELMEDRKPGSGKALR